ncbi:unnamed protein product [Caenorhabditis angaria]|uniref:F-box domain-containing protein n=1 Tax=Caenorhabditis angaria TaxID=860376 RepID=A0A9P1N0N1_9PELO|nr:unnamed protein product [Caenorhabditis angaria]
MGCCLSTSKSEEIKYIGNEWFYLPYVIRRMIIDMMDLKTKGRFAQCSQDCFEEVSQSRNYTHRIQIQGIGKGKQRIYCIYIVVKKEKLKLQIYYNKKSECEECCQVDWYLDDKMIGTETFGKQDLIEINDFPYNRTNINNLKSGKLEILILNENIHGIDPISSGFVDFDTISRFQNHVRIPNCKLDDLFKMTSIHRQLYTSIFSLKEFENFLRRILIQEKYDDNLNQIIVNYENYENDSYDLIRVIKYYTTYCGWMIENATKLGFDGYLRDHKRIQHLEHCIIMKERDLVYVRVRKRT